MTAPTRGHRDPAPPDLPKPPLEPGGLQETAWFEVVRKMEEVYSDLLRNQVDLEEKNAALEEAQRFIESVLGSMSDVLIVCDRNGRVQQVNAAACAQTAFAEPELIGRQVRELLAAGDCALAGLRIEIAVGV